LPSSAPGMPTSRSVCALEDGGDAHPTADAQRRQPVARVAPGKLVQQLHGEHGATGANWMPECDGTAHRVQFFFRDTQLPPDRDGNGRKGFIDFEYVDVLDAEAS